MIKIYPILIDVYKEPKRLNDGANQIEKETGRSNGFAKNCIKFFVNLKKGECNKDAWGPSEDAIRFFFEKTRIDDGADGLRVAIEALRKYIEHHAKHHNSNNYKALCQEFSAKL